MVQICRCIASCAKEIGAINSVYVLFVNENYALLFLDDNITETSPPSTTLLTVIVVPSFMIGVMVGVFVISLLMILR